MTNFQSIAEVITEVPLFEVFPGRPVEQMPILLDAKPKRVPLTTDRVFDLRTSENPDRDGFRNNYFTVSDQAIVSPDSPETKIVLYENPVAIKLASSLQSTNQLVNWSLPVDKDMYNSLEGEMVHTIPAGVVQDLLNKPYSHTKEREAIFEFLTRGNRRLLTDNLKLQEEKGRTLDESMGVYLSKYSGMRLLWLGSVGGYSIVGSYYYLDDYDGRLVGELAPEVQRAMPKATQKNYAPPQSKVIDNAWSYIKVTPATQLSKKGLTEVIRASYKK